MAAGLSFCGFDSSPDTVYSLFDEPMRWPIRKQILLPFALLQGVVIMIISFNASWTAAQRAERESIARLDQVVRTLSESRFPVQSSVLKQMKGLSGADFIATDANGILTASTLSEAQASSILSTPRTTVPDLGRLSEFQPVSVAGETWLIGGVQTQRSPDLKELLVLIPESEWQAIRNEVVFPPLLIGGCALLAMVGLSYMIAAKLGARLDRMQRHVGKLATMEFENLLPVSGNDELTSLALSINRMAIDLQRATQLIRMSERTTLITQVAGGLAHQLRNSITGARMAIQLQMRRSPNSDMESLRVANRQLSLTENQIRGLLSLTRDARQEPVLGQIDQILESIRDLLEPQFLHSATGLQIEFPAEQLLNSLAVADAEQVQSALLNLIQNALEASRPNGQVRVVVALTEDQIQVDVLDNGPGIADHVNGRIFEPFVTGKPEGVGLGLTLAAQVAESAHGKLTCDRIDSWTRFRFQICRIR
jgi:signal transduction histidine kinase